MESSDNRKKKKSGKSRKEDLLAGAAKEEMKDLSILSEFTGSDGENSRNEIPRERKKELSDHDNDPNAAAMEEERLKKVDPAALEEKEFYYEEKGSKWKTIIGAAAITAVLVFGYFLFFGTSKGPQLFLGTELINKDNYKLYERTNMVFPLGKKIYIYFITGGRLGLDTVNIRVLESDKNKKYFLVGSVQASGVKPNWRRFSTHFQEEYFDHPGDYKIQIVNGANEVLAENTFKIKEK